MTDFSWVSFATDDGPLGVVFTAMRQGEDDTSLGALLFVSRLHSDGVNPGGEVQWMTATRRGLGDPARLGLAEPECRAPALPRRASRGRLPQARRLRPRGPGADHRGAGCLKHSHPARLRADGIPDR